MGGRHAFAIASRMDAGDSRAHRHLTLTGTQNLTAQGSALQCSGSYRRSTVYVSLPVEKNNDECGVNGLATLAYAYCRADGSVPLGSSATVYWYVVLRQRALHACYGKVYFHSKPTRTLCTLS